MTNQQSRPSELDETRDKVILEGPALELIRIAALCCGPDVINDPEVKRLIGELRESS